MCTAARPAHAHTELHVEGSLRTLIHRSSCGNQRPVGTCWNRQCQSSYIRVLAHHLPVE